MSANSLTPRLRILVAVDGSQPSKWAVTVARQYAERLSAQVKLLNVIDPEDRVTENAVTAQQRDAAHQAEGMEALEHARAAFASMGNVDAIQRVGAPANEINQVAINWQADLIVMGTRGRGRFAQLVLGSVAEAVVRAARCPVMTVAHEPKPCKPNESNWCDVGADEAAPLSANA
jgi:nucleotide-binding universal stress UspA family protein